MDLIIPDEVTKVREPIVEDDVVILIEVPRDFTKLTLSPLVPVNVKAYVKTGVATADCEPIKSDMTEAEYKHQTNSEITKFMLGVIVDKTVENDVRSYINGRPDSEVKEITAAMETASKKVFKKLDEIRESVELARLQQIEVI